MDEHDGHPPEPEVPDEQVPKAAQPGGEPASEPGTTGDSRVDEALSRLAELDDKPVGEHVAVVEDIHRALQDALAEDEV